MIIFEIGSENMINNKRISLILPCYNEADGLDEIFKNNLNFIDEIIVVDNNCTDRTVEVAKERGCKIVTEKTQGYGAAYRAGLKNATGDILVAMDSDNSYPINEIERLVKIITGGKVDFISGNRLAAGRPSGMKFVNYLGNIFLTFIARVLFFKKIKDSQSGMWVFKREVLDKMKLKSSGMSFSEEIKIEALKNGFNFKEAAITYDKRIGKEKLNRPKDGIKNLAFLFYKRFF